METKRGEFIDGYYGKEVEVMIWKERFDVIEVPGDRVKEYTQS